MKKSTVIRSDKPHAVKMTQGSNVAQRKSSAKKPEKVAEDIEPVNLQKVSPAKTDKSKRLLTTDTSAKPGKAKAQSKAPIAVAQAKDTTPTSPLPKRAAKPKPKTKTAAVKAPSTQAQEMPIWEQDNPVKARIEKLKALNAQLSEQLQRLPSSRSA